MSDSEDDDSRQRFKVSKTQQLISQLEQKMVFLNNRESYRPQSSQQANRSELSRDSNFKSKTELEKEMYEFEQKLRQFNQQAQTPLSSKDDSPLNSRKASPSQINHVVQLLSQKLETMEDEKHSLMHSKLDHLMKQQQLYETEQTQLLKESQMLRIELDSLLRGIEIEEQRRVGEQRVQILKDQDTKMREIQERSDRLIEEEEIKKSNYLIELQQLQFEKSQLQQQVQQIQKEQEMLTAHRDDVSNQLNNLMQLHNQMLQNDLRKKIVHLEEDRSSRSQGSRHESRGDSRHEGRHESSMMRHDQIETLYQLNQQLQEQMNQQLSMIRQELNEQKQINLELLQILNAQPVGETEERAQTGEALGQELEAGEQEQSSELVLPRKYSNNEEKNKQHFDQLFEKHKKQYFKKSNFNHQKPTKQSAMKMQGRKVTPTKLSKSKEKEKKVPVLPLNKENSFEQQYKRHIDDQLKKLNQIVTQSLMNK